MVNKERGVRVARKAAYEIGTILLNRWSPRAMSGESIDDTELMRLFEAARWAPSSYNNQPWRFVYAKRETAAWQPLFDLMVPFNQSWAQHAAALILIVSCNTFERDDKPSRTHSFDTGASWQNFALQGSLMGLVVHGMEGFDYDRARIVVGIPDGYTVEAMVAVGKPGRVDDLPEDLQEREQPSERKPITEFIFEGRFS